MITLRLKDPLVILGITLLAVFAFFVSILFFIPFSADKSSHYVYIDEDDTVDSVYHKLDATCKPRQMMGMRCAGFLLQYKKHLHAGRYETGEGVSTLRLLRNLRSGHQAEVHLTLPVVHTLGDMAARLAQELQADSAEIARAFTDTVALKRLNVKPEMAMALFIPNTYDVYWNITPQQLLKRMKRERDAYWDTSRAALAREQGLTPDEAYTLASIVEQESANEQERPMIAQMYLNRLRIGMKLQADPTVKFALGNFSLRRIMHEHLATDSPYNTYKYAGLPPGPICIPSLNAIKAVLHPAKHDYLYMCAKPDFSGTHNFARTYEEHHENARLYSEALDKRGVK